MARRRKSEFMPQEEAETALVGSMVSLTGASKFLSADGTEDHWRDVHWVYNNLWMDGVSEKDAPSPGAWFWLMECRSDKSALENFRAYYMKLAPSRKELDERARRNDGGESVVSLLREIEGVLNG
jgi:hypothetical protein